MARCQRIEKTRERANFHLWWPKKSSDLEIFVSHGDACIHNSMVKHEPLYISPLPEKPWQGIGIDNFTFKHDLYLILID